MSVNLILSALLALPFIVHLSLANQAQTCVCGLEKLGGFDRTLNEPEIQLPWFAALYGDYCDVTGRSYCYGDYRFCWGTIINDRYILTTAQCVAWTNATNIKVATGNENGSFRGRHEVERVFVHPNYTTNVTSVEGPHAAHVSVLRHDVALLKLKDALDLSDPHVGMVCLTSSAEMASKDMLVYIGADKQSVRQVERKKLDGQECLNRFGPWRFTADHICAGQSTDSNHCNGKTGGALMAIQRGVVYQVGLSSYEQKDCALFRKMMMYTKIDSYLPWIHSNTQDAVYCPIPYQ